jgi:molybdopterin synthase catalytic subunit
MKIRFFAQARERSGCEELEMAVAQPVSADELWVRLERQFPGIGAMQSATRLALNHEYAAADATFSDADEVALIPPVSGG